MGHPAALACLRGPCQTDAYVLGRAVVLRLRVVLPFVALVASWVSPALAQETSCLHRTLPVTVRDSHGLRFHGPTPADFQAKFRGKPVKILAIRPDKRPHRLVILLDTSGSMRGELGGREWKIASTVAAHIGQSDLKNTSFALLLFSDSVREQIDFSQFNSAVASRLLDIWSDTTYAKKSVRGRTALLDAIFSALRLLGDSRYSESVYVISDGGDNVSRSHLNDVRKALAAAQVRLHVTLLTPDSHISPSESMGATDLRELATELTCSPQSAGKCI
jgi:Mg-chelatase subunit ChlD